MFFLVVPNADYNTRNKRYTWPMITTISSQSVSIPVKTEVILMNCHDAKPYTSR